MGLLRASLVFIIGNFSLSIMNNDNYLKKIKEIPVVGDFFGDNIIKIITNNKTMTLLIILTFIEFIL